jgi:NAD-dependent deacetylase
MALEITDELVERLRTASRVAVLTGAGISIESGVPTLRQAHTGLWERFDISELATPQAFLRNPRLVWNWYAHRRRIMEEASPSPAHYALVDLEQHYSLFTVITQNIDGLHWRAGSRELLELHGNVGRARCFDCGSYAARWDDDEEVPPRCARCGGWLRPDVVLLGEGLSEQELRRAYRATETAQVFLAVGTSASIQPAASLPLIARRSGALVIVIDPEETVLSVVADYWLREKANEVLPALVQYILHTNDEEKEEER